MEFTQFTPSTIDFTSANIEWKLSDTIEDLDNYVLILRRGATQVELEDIDILDINTVTYEDTTISGLQFDKHFTLFYQVEAHNYLDESKSVLSEIKRLNQPSLNWVAIEIIRRDKIGLENVLGTTFTLLKLKRSGVLCDCYDITLGRRSIPGDCLTCYNTNYVGGYYYPYTIYGTIGAWGENQLATPAGEQRDSYTTFLTTFYPRIEVGDVIVDSSGNRWYVANYGTSRLNTSPIKQLLQLSMIDRSNPVYKVPITIDDMINPGSVYTTEAANLFARMDVQPSTTDKVLINQLIIDLQANNIWDKLVALYIFSSHSSQSASLNWKGSSYNINKVNSPLFIDNVGFQGDGFTSYLDTTFSLTALPSTISFGVISDTNVDENSTDFGNRLLNFSSRKNDLFEFYVNSDIAYTEVNTNSQGFFALTLVDTEVTVFKNNILINTTNITNIDYSNESIFIGAKNDTGPVEFSSRTYKAGFISNYLTTSEMNTLYTLLKEYTDA